MEIVISSIVGLVVIEGLLIFFLAKFDKKNLLDKDLNPVMTLSANYAVYLATPIGLYIFLLVGLTILTQDYDNWLFSFLPSFVLTCLLTSLLVVKRFRRFYFTDNGLEILYLATNKLVVLKFSDIKRIGIKKAISNQLYFIEGPRGQIIFSRNQLADTAKFKNHFVNKGIGFYSYDSITGNYVKTD